MGTDRRPGPVRLSSGLSPFGWLAMAALLDLALIGLIVLGCVGYFEQVNGQVNGQLLTLQAGIIWLIGGALRTREFARIEGQVVVLPGAGGPEGRGWTGQLCRLHGRGPSAVPQPLPAVQGLRVEGFRWVPRVVLTFSDPLPDPSRPGARGPAWERSFIPARPWRFWFRRGPVSVQALLAGALADA